MDTGMIEHRYRVLRNHLDDLGYRQVLVIESLPLVERLVADLLHTTESLRHYKDLAQKSLEKCKILDLGHEPYKLDNSRLVKECNELHLKLLHQQEDAQRSQKELKQKLRKLESDSSDLQFLNTQLVAKLKTLEQESSQKSRKILQLQSKGVNTISVQGGKKKHLPSKPQATFELDTPLMPGKSWQQQYKSATAQAKDPYIANMVEISDKRISDLSREVHLLKEEKTQQAEIIATFKNQLNNRDREIERLSKMLEGGRPITAIRKDCCCSCKDLNHQVNSLRSEVKMLEHKKEELEKEVKESVASQHEAMTRAVMLAERNKKLEQELRDIDQMALAVEAEYSSSVKENSVRVSKIQEKLENSLMQIHDLEREVLELKRNNQELQASVEAMKNEKHHLQRKLEIAVDEKKKNSDRINELKIIERGLNNEIERMVQETTLQKRRIAELECQLVSGQAESDSEGVKLSTDKTRKKQLFDKQTKSKGPSVPVISKSATGPSKKTPTSPSRKSPTSPRKKSPVPPRKRSVGGPKAQTGDIVSKQPSPEYSPKLTPKHYEDLIEKLQSERDFYYQECLKSREARDVSAISDNTKELQWKLNEKEVQLEELKKANQELIRERERMRTRFISAPTKEARSTMTSPRTVSPTCLEQGSGMTLKAALKRLERERDLAKGDVQRLEEERDALRERLKIATETQVAEHARLEKTVIESEERVRKLEAERRELLASQGSRKATISNIESQLESTQHQLLSAQSELSELRALYNQIKSLQEQTDRALADSQGQLVQVEMELNNARERVRQLEKDRAGLDREVANLKTETSIMRGTLAQVDQEKDGLLISIDTKTERIAMLEQELKAKEDRTLKLEECLAETRKKLSIALDDIATRDSKSRNVEKELEKLRHDFEMCERARESSINENRLLHNDLAALMEDLRKSNHDLELSRQEVENLKHQLQEYVSEVKRVEDILSRKEEERGEMLDHFRSLSLEASALENNNHSLETEVQETRTQLRVTNDHIVDLQQQLESRDTLVRGYENQIAELSANVARLETRLHEESTHRHRTEEDLSIVRDLCTKLDGQKEGLMHQVTENDLVKMQLETELARLRDDQELIQEKSTRDHEAIQTLENLLSSCRQETLNQKVANQETQKEVTSLRKKVTELQEKLNTATTDLQRYQQQAVEYSQNVTELQRAMTNERFERAREEETRRQHGPNYMEFYPTESTPLSPLPSTSSHSSPVFEVEYTRKSAFPSCTLHCSDIPLSQKYQQLIEKGIPTPSAPPLSPDMSEAHTAIERSTDLNQPIPSTSREKPWKKLSPASAIPSPRSKSENPCVSSALLRQSPSQPAGYKPVTQSYFDNVLHTNVSISGPSHPLLTYSANVSTSVFTSTQKSADPPATSSKLSPVNQSLPISTFPTTNTSASMSSGTYITKSVPISTTSGYMYNISSAKRNVNIVETLSSNISTKGKSHRISSSNASVSLSPNILTKESSHEGVDSASERRLLHLSTIPEVSLSPTLNTNTALHSTATNASSSSQYEVTTESGKMTLSKQGEEMIYSTFTSAGSPIMSYTANYTVVRQSGRKDTTSTTASMQDSSAHPVISSAPPTGGSPKNFGSVPASSVKNQSLTFSSAPNIERRPVKCDSVLSSSCNSQNFASLNTSYTEGTSSKFNKQKKDKCVSFCGKKNQTRAQSTNVDSPLSVSHNIKNCKERSLCLYEISSTCPQNQQSETNSSKKHARTSINSVRSLKSGNTHPSVTDIHASYSHLSSSSNRRNSSVRLNIPAPSPRQEFHSFPVQHRGSLSTPDFNATSIQPQENLEQSYNTFSQN